MKTTISFIVTAFAIIFILSNNLTGQEVIIKSQAGEKKFIIEKNLRTDNDESFSNQKTQKSESGVRQNSSVLKLNENFDSAVFPTDEWNSYNNGWQQAGYSSYGTGNYSAYFCNFCCAQSYNELR
ncbi:MAG: hypothetical protein LH629_06860, partial [Ignavibacteria bacterium]|nr:hypothetical protein [Ignavibacteria bacterium]